MNITDGDLVKGRKKTRRRLTALERLHEDCGHPEPGHESAAATAALASGYTEGMRQEQPDEMKATRCVGAEAEIPVSSTDQDYEQHARLGTRANTVGSLHSVVPGEDTTEAGSSKALGTPSDNPLAYALRYAREQAAKAAPERAESGNLRQSSTMTSILATLHTARGNVQDIGFGPDSDVPGGFSHAGMAVLHTLDAAARAGDYRDAHGRDVLNQVNYSPYRPDSHQAPTGSGSNGTHYSHYSEQGATRPPVRSMKNSEACALIRAAMFGNG